MGSMKERLLSRKFLVAVITFIIALINAITGADLIAEDIVNDIFTAAGLLVPVFWSILEAWVDKNGAAAAVQANVAQYEVAIRQAQTAVAAANQRAESAFQAARHYGVNEAVDVPDLDV